MSATWFVVLSQARMKIFTRAKEGDALGHLKTLTNDEVGLRGKDLLRHQVGALGKGAQGGNGIRNALHDDNTAHAMIVGDFIHEMAAFLEGERKKNQFKELHISAEPRVLGLIKAELSEETKRHVRAWIHKDLEKADVVRLGQEFAAPAIPHPPIA